MGVNITRAKNNLNRTEPTDDAVICMLFSGVAVAGKAALGTPYTIYGSDGLTTYGIAADTNPVAFADITDFYGIAGEGAELNFMLMADTTQLGTACDKTQNIAKKLLDATEGRAVIFLANVKKPTGYNATITNGLDADIWTAATNLNAMAVDYQTANMPFVGILPGLGFTAATIANLPARSALVTENVAACLACEKNDGHVSMGILAGWLAKLQVNQNVGAVANGKIVDTAYYPDGSSALSLKNSAATITAKGFIQFVKVGGKSGYFYNDDPTLTDPAGDYTSLSWNRTMNKGHRLAYDVLVEKLNIDVDVNTSTGKVESTIISDWESDVEGGIRNAMMKVTKTKLMEIDGIKCTIDPNSDIINDEIDGSIEIVRKGQAKTINMSIAYAQTI